MPDARHFQVQRAFLGLCSRLVKLTKERRRIQTLKRRFSPTGNTLVQWHIKTVVCPKIASFDQRYGINLRSGVGGHLRLKDRFVHALRTLK